MNSSEQQSYETPWSHVRAVERDSFGGVPFALDAAAIAGPRVCHDVPDIVTAINYVAGVRR